MACDPSWAVRMSWPRSLSSWACPREVSGTHRCHRRGRTERAEIADVVDAPWDDSAERALKVAPRPRPQPFPI